MTKEIIGKCKLLELLRKADMTQIELSELTGISKQQINEYISNTRTMSLFNAKIIANVMKCYVDDLYEWKL